MARLPAEKGGWFKIWGKQWLKDQKIQKIGDAAELAFLRVLCFAEACHGHGSLIDTLGNPCTAEDICKSVRISIDSFNILLENGLISREDGYYVITGWIKYQNRSSFRDRYDDKKSQNEKNTHKMPQSEIEGLTL